MTPKYSKGLKQKSHALSRRTFLRLGAGGLTVIVGGTLTGCHHLVGPLLATTPIPQPASTTEPRPISTLPPTWTPTPTYQPPTPPRPDYTPVPATPTSPPEPTSKPTSTVGRTALMAHWPETATSRVALVRHGGVWDGDTPNPDIVLQMLDAGISALTDAFDPLATWRALFDPGERVLLMSTASPTTAPPNLPWPTPWSNGCKMPDSLPRTSSSLTAPTTSWHRQATRSTKVDRMCSATARAATDRKLR